MSLLGASRPVINFLPRPMSLARSSGTQVDQTNVKIQQGYGQISKAGISATIGATVTADVEMVMHGTTSDLLSRTTDSYLRRINKFDQVQKFAQQLGAHNDYEYFFGVLGFLGGRDFHKSSQQTTQVVDETDNQEKKNLMHDINSMTTSEIKLTGRVQVTGVSFIPSEAFLFAEIMTIHGKDQNGKDVSYTMIDQNPNVLTGDQNGNENNTKTGNKHIRIIHPS